MTDNNLIKKEKISRLPSWIKFPISKASEFEKIQTLIKKSNIHTICEEARCPNRAECYASGTATFLLGGSICSRSCAFCQVNNCLLYTSPSPRDRTRSRMPSSA